MKNKTKDLCIECAKTLEKTDTVIHEDCHKKVMQEVLKEWEYFNKGVSSEV